MKESKVWFITGASSGIGLEISKAALAAGYKVVATGRDREKVSKSIGKASDNLLVVKLDVTNSKEIESAVRSSVDKFATIDVLVNNAGNFYAGFFEELKSTTNGTSIGYKFIWTDECDTSCASCSAKKSFRPYHYHFINCRTCRL